MDEVSLGIQLIKFLDLPSGVVGVLFTGGMIIRSLYRRRKEGKEKAKEVKAEKRDRLLDGEVGSQLDFKVSDAYKYMSDRVFELNKAGDLEIDVWQKGKTTPAPFGKFLEHYHSALKEVAFKIVKPCIINKLKDEEDEYMGEDFHKWLVDTSEDIQKTFVSRTGRKIGTTEFCDGIENEILNKEHFLDMLGKIIRKAREL